MSVILFLTLASQEPPQVRVTYCSVSIWSEVMFKPLVLGQLLPCVNSSVHSMSDTFKLVPNTTLIVPE